MTEQEPTIKSVTYKEVYEHIIDDVLYENIKKDVVIIRFNRFIVYLEKMCLDVCLMKEFIQEIKGYYIFWHDYDFEESDCENDTQKLLKRFEGCGFARCIGYNEFITSNRIKFSVILK